MGGWKKEGGGKPHEWHPSQKGGLDPPSYGAFSTPLGCRSSVFPKQKSTRNCMSVVYLVASYCAIPWDYLSDTPYCPLWVFFGVSDMTNSGQYPLPFAEPFPPWRACEVEVPYPPPPPPKKKGYLSNTCAILYENKAKWVRDPSAILSRKGIARYGGVSRIGPLRLHTNIFLELISW